MDSQLDIPYSPFQDPLRSFDLFIPTPPSDSDLLPPLICFLHGGAWRSEDKSDHHVLARKLATFTRFPVAVPNYRLSLPALNEHQIRHPTHAEDILQFLNFLVSWKKPGAQHPSYDPHRIFLMGHSCSAHMLCSVFLNSSPTTPTLVPPPETLRAVKGIVMSEGIYNIDLLLARFPPYRQWFIEPAFGEKASFAPFSVTSYQTWNHDIHWLIVHSTGDTLVDVAQSLVIQDHLHKQYGNRDQYRIACNIDQLDQEHDEILKTDRFVFIVGDFIHKILKEDNRYAVDGNTSDKTI
ncbi:Alpha/Beta hydrolase protein [Cyathus striatus]|nr:Alpha/Beta hydrolase protein [Cyathus striatus]